MPPPVRNTGSEPQSIEGYPPLTSPGFFPPFLMPGQYYPAPGQYWPPYPYNLTPSPVVVLGEPGSSVSPPNIPYTTPQSSYDSKFAMPQAYSAPVRRQDPLVYLGTAIADPVTPLVTQKQDDYDPWKDYNAVMRAIAIGASDPEYLIKVLMKLNLPQMNTLSEYFADKQHITMVDAVDNSTSGNLRLALRGLILGPLAYDVELARKALVGLGTNETLLIELVLGRPGHEIRWLKTAYKQRYGKDLVDDVKSDLSGSTKRMFTMALNGQKPENEPYNATNYSHVNSDVEELNAASKKKDDIPFFEILINRSDQHLAAVIAAFGARYKSLSKVIKKTFRGTVEHGLLFIVHGVKPKRDQQGIWRDAKLLEKSMAGMGTKDQQLIYRLVRAHWNPERFEAIKDAYKRRYGRLLENRVRGETSGTYRDLLIAIVKSSGAPTS
ncbi:hypothetical protein HYPSUDRAFT_51172 [Hypholoma sublateritium FD-334 SS-4]|uniref:Annexin n=1 Tax=Hypholoma sublateritium (strain FD-334 SS-4) TaxID=945553 RepID=A0A0D2LKP1_HYPSF|nr:hypothetical protein HYPSUDRAFT_51172 [Hypholoma sublateritium FD-334 SS-4]